MEQPEQNKEMAGNSVADIWDALEAVYDPELMINIVDLGLVYRVKIEPNPDNEGGQAESTVAVDFTLTSPGCPLGPEIKKNIIETLRERLGLRDVVANIVWSPPWTPEFMAEEARLGFGYAI